MSRPHCLYFHLPGSNVTPELIAESDEPLLRRLTLWNILLTGAMPGPAAPHIAGDSEELTSTLQTPALEAIERYARFAAFILSHPSLHDMPGLPLFVNSGMAFLRQRLASFDGHDMTQVMLVMHANTRCDGDMPQVALHLALWGQKFDAILRDKQYLWLKQCLVFARYPGRSDKLDWQGMSRGFGLFALSHTYFHQLGQRHARGVRHPPAAIAYDEFTNGVRPPPASASKLQVDRTVTTDTRHFGAGAALPTPATYDQRLHNGTSCDYVRRGQLWGLMNSRGHLVHPCLFDSIGNRYQADESLLNAGWEVRRDGRAGWLNPKGVSEVSCQWDEVVPCHAAGLYLVREGERWGMVARDQLWLPCAYLGIEPIAVAAHVEQPEPVGPDEHAYWSDEQWNKAVWPEKYKVPAKLAKCPKGKANLLIAVQAESGMGVVDQANRVVVPLIYANVRAAQNGVWRDPRFMRLARPDGRQGLWDIAMGKEVIACEHLWLDVIVGPELATPLVVTFDDEHYRLWHVDGTPVFEARFRWLTASLNQIPYDYDFLRLEKREIAQALSDDAQIRGLMEVDGEQVARVMRLRPGQPMRDEYDMYVQAWQARGDRHAAFRLTAYAQGRVCQPMDLPMARLWAGRACGYEAPPMSAVVSGSWHRDAELESASIDFAALLISPKAGTPDPALAREWAQRAWREDRQCWAWVVLGQLMDEYGIGPDDPENELVQINRLKPGSTEADWSNFYHAQCLLAHADTAENRAKALELLLVAVRNPWARIEPMLVGLLRKVALQDNRADAPELLAQADEHERRYAGME